ncbi:MAG: iron ABC transporter permease [Actinomycetota bacterium]|nr:iron ABC transporter permease [Actinomycetota bacterium]
MPPVHTRTATILIVGLAVALVAIAIIAAGNGQLHVPPGEVLGSILHRLGIDIGPMPSHPRGEAALWNVRFPRVVMAIVVGAALGGAGAVLQAVFGNPLAEPSVIGVSSGAAVGACLVIVFEWTFIGTYTIPLVAFLTGLVTTLLIYSLSRSGGRTEVVTLVLMGIAVNAVTAAIIAYTVFLGDTQAREQIVFWQLGSFNGARWESVRVITPLVIIGLVGVMLLAKKFDLLALGERAARHVGVNVERLRLVAIVLVALLVASGVAFAGIIAFVGLIVPHVVRMIIGPAHRTLVPASILGGAVVMVLADLVARNAVDYADLPIGMLTALVGGPFFFWLLRRERSNSGGWG